LSRDPIVSVNIDVLVFFLSIIASIAMIVIRRKKIKNHIIYNNLEKTNYSKSQLFGIVGIIFFIFPIFWIVGVMLQKGAFVLLILILGIFNPPAIVSMIAKSVVMFTTMVFLFLGVYIVCDFMWPNRYKEKDFH
jgi:hypothetical protein